MFPSWSLQQPFNNPSLPFDRMYSQLQQQHPRPQFDGMFFNNEKKQKKDEQKTQIIKTHYFVMKFIKVVSAEAMQRYMSEWQNQMLNMNMMSYFLRAPNILPQLNSSASVLTAQQQFYQQLHNHQQQSQIRPFILKDPPKKATKAKPPISSENDEMPLDLSAKRAKRVKQDEYNPGSTAASVDLNDK